MPKTAREQKEASLLTKPASELTRPELKELCSRAAEGDETAMPQLQRAFDHLEETGQRIPKLDLEENTLASLLHAMHDTNLLHIELGYRQVRRMRRKLCGPSPSELERLLVERICMSWLWCQYCEALYAQNMHNHTTEQSEFYQDRIDRAHKRFLSACKSLAQVRRLLLPPVQVNLAHQQINLAGVLPQGTDQPAGRTTREAKR